MYDLNMGLSSLATNDNTPILLIGYNRPELLKKRLEEIGHFEFKYLYISIDGSNLSVASKIKQVIRESKPLLQHIEVVNTKFHKQNLGLTKHITGAISDILQNYRYLVVVEDDVQLSKNFYLNMLNGLNLLEKHKIKGIVTGFSPIELTKYQRNKNFWRLTRYTPIWGWSCSAEIWSSYKYDISTENITLELSKSLVWNKLSENQKNIWTGRFQKIQKYPFSTWDMQLQYLSFKESFTNLCPFSRITNNQGFSDSRAVHTKGKRPKWMKHGDVDNSVIASKKFSRLSNLIMTIDSNTYAGDTRFFKGIKCFKNTLVSQKFFKNKIRSILN